MRKEFNRHRRSDKVKWIAITVAIVLLMSGLLAVITSGFRNWNVDDWFNPTNIEELPEAVSQQYTFGVLENQAPGVMFMSTSDGSPDIVRASFNDSVVEITIDQSDYETFQSSSFYCATAPVLNETNLTWYYKNVSVMAQDGKLEYNKSYTIAYEFIYVGFYSGMPTVETGDFSFMIQSSTALPPTPTKQGYTFNGWYTDEACTQKYTASTVIGNISLYAGFSANTYSVKFNVNGGIGTMGNQSMVYDKSAPLTANAFSKASFLFKGWSKSVNGAVVYANSQSVSNLSATQGAVVNLYAVWEQIKYTVTFNANGGSGSMSNIVINYGESQSLPTNAFTRNNYKFLGWATSANGAVVYTNSQSVSNLSSLQGAVVPLYAVWERVAFVVTFVADGKTVSTINTNVNAVATLPTTPVKEGHDFDGWYLSDGVTKYTNQPITADTTLTASFNLRKYVVTFIVDGVVYANYECDHGTNLSELLETQFSPLLYKSEDEHSRTFRD